MNSRRNKNIFWIDKDTNDKNLDNFRNFIEFACKLSDYEIHKQNSVKEAFDLIEENYSFFKFKLLYIVITEELSEEFFIEYNKRNSELIFLIATIIYTKKANNSSLEKNPFYGDPYLNHGKDGNSIVSLVNYVKSIQCPYYLSESVSNKDEVIVRDKISREFKLGAQFTFLNSLEEMAYPILICKCVNWSLIKKEVLEDMQKYLIKKYPNIKHIIKPSQEKDIFIPFNILAKYYLYLYTLESDFYRDLNRDLEQGKFDKYRVYIYLLYSCLNKGLLKGYNETALYRGGTLSKEEFNDLIEKFKKINANTKLSFFSKKFLSFSKKEEVANEFLGKAINNKYEGIYTKFIIEEVHNSDYCTNIDLNKYKVSEFNTEEEVLFLPFSCFEVTEIQNDKYLDNEIYIIKLKYLNEYEKKINQKYLDLLNNKQKYEEEIDEFIRKAFNSNFSKELSKCFKVELNQNLIHEYKKIFPLKKESIIFKYLDKGIDYIPEVVKETFFKGLAEVIFKTVVMGGGLFLSSRFGLNRKSGEMMVMAGLGTMAGASLIGSSIIEKNNQKKEEKRKEDEKKFLGNSNFCCASFCYGYLPQKYRNNKIPTIKWINDPKCRSCAIELIIDDNYDEPTFLIINIDSSILEINEFCQKGDIIIKYRGIPENAFSAFFALYMFSKPNITKNEFFETKNLLKNGFEDARDLIKYKTLEII